MTYADFVRESWRIEGINNVPATTVKELSNFHRSVANQARISSEVLIEAAILFTGGVGQLRDRPGMDVRVGSHIAPPGGPTIRDTLDLLCDADLLSPYHRHQAFEELHPFMDGNGRVGRLLWLHDMHRRHMSWELGFLHTWYYQSLSAYREPKGLQ